MKMQNNRKAWSEVISLFAAVLFLGGVIAPVSAAPPSKATALGDSITKAFAASCKGNVLFWELACLLRGDQPQHSWFDGNSSRVDSVHDKYKLIDASVVANKSAARSGAEMRGGRNNFAIQAAKAVAQTPKPDHVEVVLGGNDICNRDCTDPANCTDPLYTESQWRDALRSGINTLVDGLPQGSTVYMGSVPKVQDLRAAGRAKQASTFRVNCESMWKTFKICSIATDGRQMNGETIGQRLAGIARTQQRYNEIIKEEANAYNSNSNGRNPRGIEVVSEYVNESMPSLGTFQFSKDDIDGGDCFHPSIRGQNAFANLMWDSNPDK